MSDERRERRAMEVEVTTAAGVEEVWAALASKGAVDVVVTVDFAPERLHAPFFREIASVGGRVRGRQFFLSRLDQARLAQHVHRCQCGIGRHAEIVQPAAFAADGLLGTQDGRFQRGGACGKWQVIQRCSE